MGRQAEGPWPNAEQLSICDYAQDVPLAPHNVRLHEDFEFEERVFGDGDAILIWLQTWQAACRLTANDPKLPFTDGCLWPISTCLEVLEN